MRSIGPRLALAVSTLLLWTVSSASWAQTISGKALPTRGGKAALVEIVEVSDFECPYSSKAQPILKQVTRTYKDAVREVFIHHPLPFHDRALPAALASVVIQDKGKFWEFADSVFIEQDQLSAEHTRKIALRYGVAREELDARMKSPEITAFVEANRRVAAAVEARGTPTFFLNGTKIRGSRPFEALKRIIDIEIAMAGATALNPKQAAAYRQQRTKTNNPNLHAYLYEGKPPPEPGSADAKPKFGPTPGADSEPLFKALIRPTDPFRGSRDKALVTLVAFMGYQCAYSRQLMETFAELQTTYGAELGLVIKHLPLSIHPLGEEAALAALCAHEQGKFWELNERLFADTRLSTRAVTGKAADAGIEMKALQACMDEGTLRQQIREDGSLAQTIGARGTPTTFINGRRTVGAMPIEELKKVIDAELVRVRAKVKDGTPIPEVYDSLMATAQVLEPLEESTYTLDLTRSPTRGNSSAPIQVVVFSDYECPYCGALEPALQQLYQRYAGRVAVTVKHFPLNFHRKARAAAAAAVCAHAQGRFWPIHDGVFADQEHLSDEMTKELGRLNGLDMLAFDTCLEAPETAQAIDADMAEGKKIGLQGTPTVLFNGHRYDLTFGATADDLAQTVNRLLNKSAPKK